jgi:hypothetical protein
MAGATWGTQGLSTPGPRAPALSPAWCKVPRMPNERPISDDQIRLWWWHRQGLGGTLAGQGAGAVLEQSGWSRSVGGCGPYLALHARAGLSRRQIDDAVVALEIHELPAARGCTYVVPAADFALALRAGARHDSELAGAKRHLGVTDPEIGRLCERVLLAVEAGPLDPAGIKEAVGDAVRHLGEAGKKRGMTTTLPLALGVLQARGELRRVPVDGRLDQQRYRYARWRPSPLAGHDLPGEEVTLELARRFFRWAGPATVKQLAWWAGLSVKAARAAAQALALAPLPPAAGDGEERLMHAEDLDALRALRPPPGPQYALVGSLDNVYHPRRSAAELVDPADLRRPAAAALAIGEGAELGGLGELPHHAILDRGRLVGFWDYDGAGRIAWATFAPPAAALAAEVARVEAWVRDELGDARSFSLDSPQGRGDRLARLREAAAAARQGAA